ncbi:NAD(P)/FAD-dependent oxidoreductase [Caldibacillus lycopersici]|uniref:NAD(P)/FAD-dependent oxidoreductase n=1 Tax=Perspicuibacillus lycopersici TaxID=1325689 RepID=A0AAE3IQZ0_9BACI|nr:NAD(P)/FAD-dependent oxidoreductase [Perspicuibacillus lycopersici]MCU9612817.1 NAD(P)/FAD-dependent oxidoreductase [Perspicuibacillus lycopersici]
MRKLVLLGGGYGGMKIMQKLLPDQLPEDVHITLIDKVPYHSLKTEFYALAAGTLPDQHVRVTFPEHERLTIVYGEITQMNIVEKLVSVNGQGTIPFDDLVIGLGCEDKYHSVPGANEYTYGIQSIEASRRTYSALNNLPGYSKVAIVGAGLSGVELASELHESRPDLDIRIYDRGKNILSAFPEKLSTFVTNWFQEHNIQVINESNITKVEEGILYNHDDPIEVDVIVWTAGIQPNKLVRELEVEKDAQGRVLLTPYHNLPANEHVYVVGDCASLPFAPSAQLAEAQAEQIVQVLLSRWKQEELPEKMPEMKLKGVLGSLGRKQGFGLVADHTLTGRVPRLLKSGILWLYKFHNG